jgi:drug/metabolite transporter (DMT)-like permease
MTVSSNEPGLKSWLILILLALTWGSSFILIKKGLLVFDAGEVGAIRIVAAGLVLLPIAISRLSRVSANFYRLLFISGLLGNFIPAFLFAFAQTRLESGITGILNALTPLFALLVGIFLFDLKYKWKDGIGLLFGFGGCIILILTGERGNLGSANYYAILVVLATVCYGTNINLIKKFFVDLRSLEITAMSLVFVAPIALVYLIFFTEFSFKIQNSEGAYLAFSYILILGVMGTAVALIFFNMLVKLTTPVFASTVTYLIPVVAVIWGILDGESLFPGHYLGMALIIGGVYLANRPKKK